MKKQPVKGKIPRAEWPTIIERYRQHESLIAIAARYGCTAPAISYILRQAKATRGKPEMKSTQLVRNGSAASKNSTDSVRKSGEVRVLKSSVAVACQVDEPDEGRLGDKLRERISDDIASFVVALSGVISEMTPDNLDKLLETSDKLMLAASLARVEGIRLRALLGGRWSL
jgi:hypothetical protein